MFKKRKIQETDELSNLDAVIRVNEMMIADELRKNRHYLDNFDYERVPGNMARECFLIAAIKFRDPHMCYLRTKDPYWKQVWEDEKRQLQMRKNQRKL